MIEFLLQTAPTLAMRTSVQIKSHGQMENHVPWAFGTILSVSGVVWSPLRARVFPSSSRRGVRDLDKMSRSLLDGADGVVIQFRNKFVLEVCHQLPAARYRACIRSAHPRLRAEDASRLFLIAQPPLLGEEGKSHRPPQLSCVTSLIRPA